VLNNHFYTVTSYSSFRGKLFQAPRLTESVLCSHWWVGQFAVLLIGCRFLTNLLVRCLLKDRFIRRIDVNEIYALYYELSYILTSYYYGH